MKKGVTVILSVVFSVLIAGTALAQTLSTTAQAATTPRVKYQIVSNSATPTIKKGDSFEANFYFYDIDDVISVTSPNGSIINLPKDKLEDTDEQPSDDSESTNKSSFSINIPENNMRYVGTGPAILKFKIVSGGSTTYLQKTITECQPTTTSSGTEKSGLSLQKYSLDRSGIKEGERFNLTLTVKNDSGAVNNHVTALLDGLNPDDLTVDGQLDTKTVTTLNAGETTSITFPLICNAKMASKNYMLKVNLSSDEYPTAVPANVFIPVTGTKAQTDTSSSGSDKPGASKPLIMIESYDYGGKPVIGGQNFNLKMRFRNTNTAAQIENLKITVSSTAGTDDKSAAGVFTPAKSSNTFFVPKVAPNGSFNEEIALIPKSDATPNSYGVNIAFNYESVIDNKREAIESTETIAIPLTQPDRFEANEADIGSPMFLGEQGQLNINYVNKGKSKIFNLSVKLSGNFTSGETNSYIGNVDSGVGDSFQATITPTAEGQLKGTAVFSYEDASGATKSITKEFSGEVQAAPTDTPTDSQPTAPQPEQGTGTPWYYWAGGSALLIVLLVVLRIVLKKRKAKKLRILEESDDDDPSIRGGKAS